MAFRLQSMLAGGAKTLSSKLKTLEEDTKELITTEASRVAQEMSDARKARIKNTVDYNTAARKLQRFGLDDAQIEAVLSAGLTGADDFVKSMETKALKADLKGLEFNVRDAAQSMFSNISPDISGRSIEEQAQAFAAAQTPYAGTGIGPAAQRISTAVGAMGRGDAPTDYITSQLKGQVGAAGGDAPEAFTGRAFGTATGYQFSPELTTVEGVLAARKTEAEIAGREAGTKLTLQQVIESETMLPLQVQEREARIDNIIADTGIKNVTADRIVAMLPSEIAVSEAQAAKIISDIEKNEAIMTQMLLENDQIAANADFIRAKMDNLIIETDLLEEFGPQERRAKIIQLNTAAELNKSRVNQIESEIAREDELQPYVVQIKKQELEALKTGDFADIEEFQTNLIAENHRLETELASGLVRPEEEAAIRNRIAVNEEAIASASVTLAASSNSNDFFSKSSAPTLYNHLVKQNLSVFDVTFDYADFETSLASIDDTQMPKFFAAVIQATNEFDSLYNTSARGARFANTKMCSINNDIRDYSQRQGDAYLGRKTLAEIGAMTDVSVGQTISYLDPQTNEEVFAVYTGGTFVSSLEME